jgi:hypothetical protein
MGGYRTGSKRGAFTAGWCIQCQIRFSFFEKTTQKNNRPREYGAGRGRSGCAAFYWLGRRSCVKPVVLMSRKSGVRGGNSEGVRNSVSKL